MVKLKNVSFKKCADNSFNEKSFQEPAGMTDVDLREVVTNSISEKNDSNKNSKIDKCSLSKVLFCFGTGFLILTGILITSLLLNDSITTWSNSTKVPEVENFLKTFTIYNKLSIDAEEAFPKNSHQSKREISSLHVQKSNHKRSDILPDTVTKPNDFLTENYLSDSEVNYKSPINHLAQTSDHALRDVGTTNKYVSVYSRTTQADERSLFSSFQEINNNSQTDATNLFALSATTAVSEFQNAITSTTTNDYQNKVDEKMTSDYNSPSITDDLFASTTSSNTPGKNPLTSSHMSATTMKHTYSTSKNEQTTRESTTTNSLQSTTVSFSIASTSGSGSINSINDQTENYFFDHQDGSSTVSTTVLPKKENEESIDYENLKNDFDLNDDSNYSTSTTNKNNSEGILSTTNLNKPITSIAGMYSTETYTNLETTPVFDEGENKSTTVSNDNGSGVSDFPEITKETTVNKLFHDTTTQIINLNESRGTTIPDSAVSSSGTFTYNNGTKSDYQNFFVPTETYHNVVGTTNVPEITTKLHFLNSNKINTKVTTLAEHTVAKLGNEDMKFMDPSTIDLKDTTVAYNRNSSEEQYIQATTDILETTIIDTTQSTTHKQQADLPDFLKNNKWVTPGFITENSSTPFKVEKDQSNNKHVDSSNTRTTSISAIHRNANEENSASNLLRTNNSNKYNIEQDVTYNINYVDNIRDVSIDESEDQEEFSSEESSNEDSDEYEDINEMPIISPPFPLLATNPDFKSAIKNSKNDTKPITTTFPPENNNVTSNETITSNDPPTKLNTETVSTYGETPLNVRWSGQESNNFENLKNHEFVTISEHLQSNQQSSGNYPKAALCPTFVTPMGLPILQQASAYPYLYNAESAGQLTNVFPFSRAQNSPYITQQYPFGTNLMPSYPKAVVPNGYLLYNGQNPVGSSMGGQYYICNPLPSMLGASKMEVVPEVGILRTSSDDSEQQQSYALEIIENRTRAAQNCPLEERSCEDDSKCIKVHSFCDGSVQCKDASDEAFCPCKFRIDKSRMCDGYFDCPNGEDELKCFGCELGMFNCDDWSPRDRLASCIPMEQRCDGTPQCSTGKDEDDCSILSETLSEKQHFMVSATSGFLFRNFKGRWYPACRNPEVWAIEACRSDAGPSNISPLTHLIPIEIRSKGPYVSVSALEHVKIVHSCEADAAIHVECPPLVCGLRKRVRNPYRAHEVDTSAEVILSEIHQGVEFDEPVQPVTEEGILGDSRVVGGKPSQPEAWPWVVSTYRNGVFHCGGVLINERWIVTAAHCVDKYWHYYYEVQLGVLRRYSYSPMVQNRMVSHVVSHQLYDKSKLKNDIAMMQMSEPVVFNRYVRPICLPSEVTAGKHFMWGPEPGTICTAVGWGATMEHGSDPDHLREVEVPILKHCKHREDEQGHEICAGLMEGGKDACQGDSGGPFMCRNPNVPNQWYLAGIVSHGEGCARPNEPGVYTRVSLFMEWIFENLRSEVLPQSNPLHRCPGYICRKTNRCIAKKRRCDKIVDCLMADDEFDCDKNTFNDIFKHAMRRVYWRSHDDQNDNNETVGLEIDEETSTTLDLQEESTKQINKTESGHSSNAKFVCKRMLQTVAMERKCDRNFDCEDGTDEEDCLCVDYLKNTFPNTICDGVVDCADMSDEQNCDVCEEDEYHCHQSNTCIPNENKCNSVADCPMAEDELDCFALTNGRLLMLDGDFRPQLKSSGVLSFNNNGTWRVLCGNWTDGAASLAADVCVYLGFSDYKSFLKVSVYNDSLRVVRKNSEMHFENTVPAVDKCTTLFVKCLHVIDTKHSNEYENVYKSIDSIAWNAEIYVNGRFQCTGVILSIDWIVTSFSCFQENLPFSNQYAAVLLGGRRTYLNAAGVHEQVIKIINYTRVAESFDIIVLKLQKNIKFSRYIRPISFSVKDYEIGKRETCVALGRNFENHTTAIVLEVMVDCPTGFRCFNRITTVDVNCPKNQTHAPWSGSIVCRSKNGWYPTAVYHEPEGFCGFASPRYTSIQYWKANIIKLMNQPVVNIATQPCSKGFRCNLGECMEENQVCDGIGHCRDGMDEDPIFCDERKALCNISSSCACSKSELKCRNGKCVSKSSFCNKINDCGDWSDEPDRCSCGAYLELTNPTKVCDGIRNCQDRTDEQANVCKCKDYHFVCKKSNRCVAKDMVCDGIPDCPNGEDEAHCLALVSPPKSYLSEVRIRTAGVWHSGCFPNLLTTLQLEALCVKLGYVSGSALRVYSNNRLITNTTWRPTKDVFEGVWINQQIDKKLILFMRTGDKPLISFVPDSNCYKLFLQCL